MISEVFSWLGLNQIVRIPALMPPWISEVRLSPMITAVSLWKSGILEKQQSKYSLPGLLYPSSSEIKILSK